MNTYSLKETIYAPASAPQKSGIIVVRVSGQDTINAIKQFQIPKIKPRYATVANIYHPKTKELIDHCVIIYYKAPHSFTGEDVLEISIHGGKAVLKSLLEALSSIQNFRFAEPGEFSMRALLNGKLDLAQVEGLADLINAETSQQCKLALKQLSGDLSKIYEDWRRKLLRIMSLLEACIDFAEEDIPDDLNVKAEEAVKELNCEIQKYLQDNRVGEKLRDGLYITILGMTNVGKSSLINKIARRDVAIVSHLEGTTRDVIEIEIDMKGYPVIIADTAGIRKSAEVIEAEGIKRSLERAKHADCKLIMLDATNNNHSKDILDLIDENSIVVVNKIDLLKARPSKDLIAGKKINYISTKTEEGLDALIKTLSEFAKKFFYSACSSPLITRQRHREHLTKCSECLSSFELNKGIEFAAEDLRLAASHLARITEKIDVESILGEIFSNFCIGK